MSTIREPGRTPQKPGRTLPLLSSSKSASLRAPSPWYWYSILTAGQGLALGIIALAYNGGRASEPWATALLWAGLLALWVPVAFRVLSPEPTRQERILLLATTGLALYVVKVLYSPLEFRFADEIQHWRTGADILANDRLFTPNFILPVSPLYPGLENIAAAVADLTGLPLFDAGVILMGSARLVLVLALFLFFERASGSPHVAGIATLLYMSHPHFLFLNSMFTYQAIAVAFLALVLFAEARLQNAPARVQIALQPVLVLSLVTLVATHHVTAYIMVIILVQWGLVRLLLRRSRNDDVGPLRDGALAAGIVVLWVALVAPQTVDYLDDPLVRAGADLLGMVSGQVSAGSTFRPPSSPLLERLMSIGTVGVLVVAVIAGSYTVWRRFRGQPLPLALALAALGYLGSLGLRLASNGAELTGRLWVFLYAPVGFVAAVVAVELLQRFGPRLGVQALARLALLSLVVVVFLGGITAGWPPYWERLPGPFLPGAAERSINSEGVAAATWAGERMTPFNRITTDFTNYGLLGAYGNQHSVYGLSGSFVNPSLGEADVSALRYMQIDYILVDRRLSQDIPRQGYYFDPWEPTARKYAEPVALDRLMKFDALPRVDRLFDSGNIILYDVGVITGAP